MITIQPVAAFSDNYIWLLYDSDSREAAVVDPGDARPVLAALQALDLTLTTVLITHHHMDHVGGLPELLQHGPLTVYGPGGGHITGISQPLADGDQVTALGLEFSVFTVPGHTLDHIAYYTDQAPGQPLLFCGDTLFAGGCGRLFEGSPDMMLASLGKLATLPASTLVYCAHEYTLANLAFAHAVEPANQALSQRIESARALRRAGTPTVPSTIGLELATNPFMRSEEASVREAASHHSGVACGDAVAVFAAIRGWKDNF